MDCFTRLRDQSSMYLQWDPRNVTLPSPWHGRLSAGYPKVSLDAAGLVALADLTTVARRTALTGTSNLLDIFVLSPGLHTQQKAPELNAGEYPACGAMTTGYVFRVENPATVLYLQKVGRTGHLTTLAVEPLGKDKATWQTVLYAICDVRGSGPVALLAYMAAVALTLAVLTLLVLMRDWWAVTVLAILMFARTLNVWVVRRRAAPGWFGYPEPDTKGDLIILLSQDRWVRMQGEVDDLKAVTSGQWLREPTFFESSLVAFATLLVYLDAALAGNGRQEGKLLLLILLFGSVALLGLANEYTEQLKMHGRLIKVKRQPQSYKRRLHLTKKLIEEVKTSDWAIRMGMIQPDQIPGRTDAAHDVGPKIM